jgi:hypothetical protein
MAHVGVLADRPGRQTASVGSEWMPALDVVEVDGRCRLRLVGFAQGDGSTLQEAADDLVSRLLVIAMSCRNGGFRISREIGALDLRSFEFIHELGEIAAAGGDIRERMFGVAGDFTRPR